MTSAEWKRRLEADPEWVRQRDEREARHKVAVAQLAAELEPEERPLLTELAAVGFHVTSVWDMVNTRSSYKNAIPVLCKYLPHAHHPVLREGIARALTAREAEGIAGRVLLAELRRCFDPTGSEARWALANALTVTSEADMADELRSLLADESYRDVHERLAAALRHSIRAR